MTKVNTVRRLRRNNRVSKNLVGSLERPRIRVFRSNRYIYAQAIDDGSGLILASYSSLLKTDKVTKAAKKVDKAKVVGELLGRELLKKGVKKALFDRSRYAYHGIVKSLAEGVRSSGLVI